MTPETAQLIVRYLEFFDAGLNTLAHLGVERRRVYNLIEAAHQAGGLTPELVQKELADLDQTINQVDSNLPPDPSSSGAAPATGSSPSTSETPAQ